MNRRHSTMYRIIAAVTLILFIVLLAVPPSNALSNYKNEVIPEDAELVGMLSITINRTETISPTIQDLQESIRKEVVYINPNHYINDIDVKILEDSSTIQLLDTEVIRQKRPAGRFCHLWWPYNRLWYGWYYNPPPDLDFMIGYKAPSWKKRELCITPALAVALWWTGKRLDVKVYWWRGYYYYRVVIGMTIARETCKRITWGRYPNCANWLLARQAVIRYSR